MKKISFAAFAGTIAGILFCVLMAITFYATGQDVAPAFDAELMSTPVPLPDAEIVNGISMTEIGLLVLGLIELIWRVFPTTSKLTPLTVIASVVQRLFWDFTNVKK